MDIVDAEQNQDNHGVNYSDGLSNDGLSSEFHCPSFPNPPKMAGIVSLGLNLCLSEHWCLIAARIKIISYSKFTERRSLCNDGPVHYFGLWCSGRIRNQSLSAVNVHNVLGRWGVGLMTEM